MMKHLRKFDEELSLRTPLDEEILSVYYNDDKYY